MKPVLVFFDQVQHKPGCTASADSYRRLRKKRDCTVYVVKTRMLISCGVTTQLISAFVLAYAKIRFSCEVAHFKCEVILDFYSEHGNAFYFQRFGRLLGLCRDPLKGTIWVYTSQNVFKYKVAAESRYVCISYSW